MLRQFLCFCLVFLMFTACQQNKDNASLTKQPSSELGELQHQFILNEGTEEFFNKGLLLLHNFEYEDALTAFKKGAEQDSTEVLILWGEAMSYYKALWRLQNMDKGQEILSRLGADETERLAAIDDPLENDLWQGLEIIYGEGDFEERNKIYANHMEGLYEKYPGHQEIAAFYALSLIWATEEYGDGSDDLRKAARIADEILVVNPQHPGALHYKIHALDGPVSAAEAHKAADAYAKVAPDAAHALHMPSHIYLALGEWENVVNSNTASYNASVTRMENLGLDDGARGYHSYSWLHYGLLQQGRYQEAEKILTNMLSYVPKDPTKGARGYLLGMQNRQIVEAGGVGPDVKLDLDVKVDDLGLRAESMKSFLAVQVAFMDKNSKAIQDEINWLVSRKAVAATFVEEGSIETCSGVTRYAPNENTLKSTEVILKQMNAMLFSLQDNEKAFEEHLVKAVEIEAQTDYPTGPVRIARPSFEQYGNWLLQNERYDEALVQFDQALQRMPQRTKSLLGKLEALKALNKTKEAEKIEEKLRAIWNQADPKALELIAMI